MPPGAGPALLIDLLHSKQVGLAALARAMLNYTQVRYRIKRVGRFLANGRVSAFTATVAPADVLLSDTRGST